MIRLMLFLMVILAMPNVATAVESADLKPAPLRIGVVGFSHGHVHGILGSAAARDDLVIVGVVETDDALFERLAQQHGVDSQVRFKTLETMLDQAKPEAVSVMTSIKDHLRVVQACAPRSVHALLEKPLAFTADDAHQMAKLARKYKVHVLTNYETSWYASVREAKRLVKSGKFAPIRRMVFRHGHKGPRELGCSEEFLAWLTDPEQNGGGAIVDFGCYGAVLATWLMDGQRPTRVIASATTLKPKVYSKVDDDATIVLSYPQASAVIQASWCWTHDNKEMDLHTETGSIHAGKWDALTIRKPDGKPEDTSPKPKPEHLHDEWTYLRQVIRGECEVDGLSSLELNVIVAEILDQARQMTGSGVDSN